MTPLLAPVLVLALALSANAGTPAPEAAHTRWVMGSPLSVEMPHASADLADRAREAAFAEAQRLDNLLSPFLPYSPLSRLNANAGKGAVEVEPALAEYLRRAGIDSERTDGAFDITIGALLSAHRSGADSAAIAEARSQVGTWRIAWSIDEASGRSRVSLPRGVQLDPGGDGKGVAVDAMVRALHIAGVRSALVDFGSSAIYGLGHADDDAPWRVAVQDGDGRVLGIVRLSERALSMSSAMPARRGHIVDPRTGALVVSHRTAVVVASSATDADVLSTALIVEGAGGARFRERFPGAEMAVFEADATPWMTEGFARLFEVTP